MSRRAKIQDVARLAEVSLSTVSAVLNEKNIVSAATRQRVLDAIETLQYRPDHFASNLARRETNVFGLIVSNLLNPFFAETAQAIEDEARKHGFGVTLTATNFSPKLLRDAVKQMLGERIAGIAVMTSEYDEQAFAMIHNSQVPSVFLDVGKPGPLSTNIRVDTRGGMMAAVEHLVRLGHRDLLLVREAQSRTPEENGPPLLSRKFRDQGFAAAIKACGVKGVRSSIALSEGFAAAAGAQAIESVWSETHFTAVVCTTDLVALGVYRALHEHGVRIPQDVSVVGFDNTYLSEFLAPRLTSVDIPRAALSRMAVSALLPTDKERTKRTVRLATKLVVRNSTAPPRKGKLPVRRGNKA